MNSSEMRDEQYQGAGVTQRACGTARGMRGATKWLRKAEISPSEGDTRAEGRNPGETAAAQNSSVSLIFENSYLFFQEESGKMINRGVVAMDLSFKLI